MWTEIILDKYYLLLETLWILLEYFAWLLFSWHPLPFGLAIICCDGWWGLLLILVICFHHSLGLGSLELRRTLNKLWEDLFFSVKLQLKQNLFPCQFRKPHVQKLCFLPSKLVFHWRSSRAKTKFVSEKNFDSKKFGLEKISCVKKISGKKNCGSEKKVASKKYLGLKQNLSPKKFLVKKKFCIRKKCWSNKMLELTKYWNQQTCGS